MVWEALGRGAGNSPVAPGVLGVPWGPAILGVPVGGKNRVRIPSVLPVQIRMSSTLDTDTAGLGRTLLVLQQLP